MGKKLSAIGIFIALTVVLSGYTCANASVEKIEKDLGFITVSKSMTKDITPSQAEITVKIETSDTNMQVAVEKNKKIANKVYASVKKIINTENGEFLKTGNYNATPNYSYKDGKRIFDKYVVTNTIKVKIKKLDNVSKIIDTSIQQGATGVGDIQFSATNYDASCNEALAQLTKQAYEQANIVAKAANSKISGIKSISTSCSPENNARPMYRMMAPNEMLSIGASPSTPIESGTLSVYANIDASFYVLP